MSNHHNIKLTNNNALTVFNLALSNRKKIIIENNDLVICVSGVEILSLFQAHNVFDIYAYAE